MKNKFYFFMMLILTVILYENRDMFLFNMKIAKQKNRTQRREFNNILIVTMSEPTDFMLQRAVNYQKFKNSLFDVWYIFDETKHFEIPEKYKSFFEKNVYSFNSSDLTTRYPDMNDLFKNCKYLKKYKKGEEYRYFNWLTLAERVNELYQRFELKTKYLWVIEQDSAITGNLTKFMNHFDYFDEDFIGRGIFLVTKNFNRNFTYKWVLTQCLTNNFRTYFENKAMYWANIFFSRFSNRFMFYLNDFFKKGFHGDAQIIYVAVAYLNNLSFMSFPNKYVYKISSSETIYTKREYDSIKDKEYLIHKIKE